MDFSIKKIWVLSALDGGLPWPPHEIFIFEAVYIYIAIFVAQYGIEVVHFNHFAVWCRA